MATLTLQLLSETFTIHRLAVHCKIPVQVFNATVYFIGKTHDEISLVLPDSIMIKSDVTEPNWIALEVIGPLDFSLTGILANISTVLAKEKISIFAISTFDTDYILVKKDKITAAIDALQTNDYRVLSAKL